LAAGVVVMGLVVFSSLARSLAGDLPDLGPILFDYTSPAESRLLDGSGAEVTRFRLIEPIEAAPNVPPALVDAFLAASSPSFYEARARATTPLVEAVQHGARGEAPTASRLSTELARLLLADERPGIRRRIREEILATRLDAEATTAERVTAWLEWTPLCGSHRGLRRAAGCLGVPVAEWSPAEVATVAAAGVGWLDLRDDGELLIARRDAIVDLLVVRGDLDPEDAAALGPPARGRPADGPDAWTQVALARARAAARRVEPAPVVVTTWLDADLQATAARALGDASWAAVNVRSGGVAALGGDALTDAGALTLASDAARLAGGTWAEPVVLRKVEVAGREDLSLRRLPPRPPSDAWGRYVAVHALPLRSGVRLLARGDCVAAVHQQIAIAACADDGPPTSALIEIAQRLPPAEFTPPDDAFVDEQGRLMRRSRR